MTQRVWRPARRAGETGSSPVQGAFSGRSRAARQPSDMRSKAGSTPAGPTGEWTGAAPARSHEPPEAGSTPASPTGSAKLPPWPSGDGTSPTKRHSPQVRVLPGVLAYGKQPDTGCRAAPQEPVPPAGLEPAVNASTSGRCRRHWATGVALQNQSGKRESNPPRGAHETLLEPLQSIPQSIGPARVEPASDRVSGGRLAAQSTARTSALYGNRTRLSR